MDDNWLDRLTDTYVDLNIASLLIVLFALAIGLASSHLYFRWRLERAVTDGIAPSTVRLEAFAFGLAAGALLAVFSGWGFLWIAGILVLALVVALMSGARKVIAVVALIALIAILVTVAGLKLI